MSTDRQTPSHPRPPTGPRRVSPRVIAGVAAVLVAATTTGVLIATAANQPAQEPAAMTGDPTASQPVSTPTPAGAPTVTAPPTATSPPTVTAPPRSPIDTGTGPAPARGRDVDGDVDGDGRRATVTLPAAGTVRIRYATGRTDTVTFDANAGESRLLGTADADNDGRDEVFIHVDAGAYTDQTSIFRYVEGRLRLVTLNGEQRGWPPERPCVTAPHGAAGRHRPPSWCGPARATTAPPTTAPWTPTASPAPPSPTSPAGP